MNVHTISNVPTREYVEGSSGILVPEWDAPRTQISDLAEGSLMHTPSLEDGQNTHSNYMRFGAENVTNPDDLGDGEVVNVWLTPFAQRLGEATAMRAVSVKAGVDKASGNKDPLIAWAQNTIGNKEKVYTDAELDAIEDSDLTPEVTRLLQAVDMVSPNARIRLLGHSLGAQIALAVASDKRFQGRVIDVVASEPPNVVERTPKQLEKDFKGKGINNLIGLYRAQADGGSKVFRQIQGTTLFTPHRLVTDLVGFAGAARMPENVAFHHAMAVDNIDGQIEGVRSQNPDSRITVVRGDTSLITPRYPDDSDQRIWVENYGHEIHDNLALLALIAYVGSRRNFQLVS